MLFYLLGEIFEYLVIWKDYPKVEILGDVKREKSCRWHCLNLPWVQTLQLWLDRNRSRNPTLRDQLRVSDGMLIKHLIERDVTSGLLVSMS